ncbi:MAG: endolytic transglycosylase MltG [Elusimicrobiales bacterium]|nr:endolytic transglycosylase MltG [Elusimicrobiales bacterium]
MKKLKITFAAVLAVLLLACLHYFMPGHDVLFDIHDGATGGQIARDLKEQHIISSRLWFKALLRLTGGRKHLRPGRYRLRTGMSGEEVVWTLFHTDGRYYVKFAVPEGWRAEQIADKLNASGVSSGAEFLAVARAEKLEGRLFPSTYFFEEKITARQVANTMLKEFDRQVRPLLTDAATANLSAPNILVIASIVEREAVVHEERPLIAAVYLNRIKRNILLEADPTVQYAIGYVPADKSWWKRRTTLADLKVESPYNTYRYPGIPPGPICNPGLESIKAVLNPARVDSIYFVADRQGRHIFNEDYKEHLKAKRQMKEEARRRKAAATTGN